MKYVFLFYPLLAAHITTATQFNDDLYRAGYVREVDRTTRLRTRDIDSSLMNLRRRMMRAETVRQEGRGKRSGNDKTPQRSPSSTPHTSRTSSLASYGESFRTQGSLSPDRASLSGFTTPPSSIQNTPVRSVKAEKGNSPSSSLASSPLSGGLSQHASMMARTTRSERSSLNASPERSLPGTPSDFRSPGSDRTTLSTPRAVREAPAYRPHHLGTLSPGSASASGSVASPDRASSLIDTRVRPDRQSQILSPGASSTSMRLSEGSSMTGAGTIHAISPERRRN